MVDRDARKEYAQLLRQFISGRMTNWEYEDRFVDIYPNSKDKAVSEIFEYLTELFGVAQPNRMTQQWRLDRPAQRKATQAVLFLQSDQDFSWPVYVWDGSVFLITAFLIVLLFALLPETAWWIRASIAGVLVAGWLKYERWQARRWEQRWASVGDESVWPFLHQANLDEARKHPHLLNGGRERAGQ